MGTSKRSCRDAASSLAQPSAEDNGGLRNSAADTDEGLRLIKAFIAIQDKSVRAEIVAMVSKLASGSGSAYLALQQAGSACVT